MEGNVDVIFVHAKAREEEFVADGYGAYRLGVMYNDFVILGPSLDPAQVKGQQEAAIALGMIVRSKARFVSRGDDSGTHVKEQSLWEASGVLLKREVTRVVKKGKRETLLFHSSVGPGEWYYSIGRGQALIAGYKIQGQQAFSPDTVPDTE
jgi:tungstate transport system substrate-binding protein